LRRVKGRDEGERRDEEQEKTEAKGTNNLHWSVLDWEKETKITRVEMKESNEQKAEP
jgi:hypothetical protein